MLTFPKVIKKSGSKFLIKQFKSQNKNEINQNPFNRLLTTILMTSCGIYSAMVGNINNNATNVELSKKNFKVIEKVSGKSTATYVFGIGGLSNKALIEKAKSKMLENASLIGSAKAIINLTTESHISIVYPFFFQRTISVSGHIVEFTE